MRAMRIHAYSDALDEPMRLDEVPEPRPGAGQLLVRVAAAGVNPIDLSKRRGLPAYVATLKVPCVIGSECAGEVVETGEGVSGFSAGDRVFGKAVRSEAYAELGGGGGARHRDHPAGKSLGLPRFRDGELKREGGLLQAPGRG